MATIAGNNNYAIAISTTKTGIAGSETPTGDIIYLFAEDIGWDNASGDKRKLIAKGKVIKIITGKIDLQFKLGNCTISKQATASSTLEITAIENFIYNHGRVQGSDKVYLFVYNIADASYMKLSHVSSVHVQYILGYFGKYNGRMGKAKIFKIPSLTFEQVTT